LILKNQYAFTLAEVLITLVIIGVIAAITVPSVYANYRREAASAKLKKYFSTMCQVIIRAKADGKDWAYWAENYSYTGENSAEDFYKYYLLPYLNYYKTVQQGIATYVYLNDGSYFSGHAGGCLDFFYDINGDRKPNQFGKDEFAFVYCQDSNNHWAVNNNEFSVYRLRETKTRQQALEKCKEDGRYCSALVYMDGWEFKEDYPYNI